MESVEVQAALLEVRGKRLESGHFCQCVIKLRIKNSELRIYGRHFLQLPSFFNA